MSDASCRLLTTLFDIVVEAGATPEDLVAGTDIDLTEIRDVQHWVDWSTFQTLTERTAAIVGGNERMRERAAELLFASAGITGLVALTRALSGPKLLYRANARWISRQLFSVVKWTYTDYGGERCLMTLEVLDGHKAFSGFVYMHAAVMEGIPSILGLPPAEVTWEVSPDGTTVYYDVQVPPSRSLIARLMRWIRAPLSAWASVQELEAQSRHLEMRVREIARAEAEAQAASDLRSTFLSTISHELRTPLNGVMGTAELLLAEPLGTEERELMLANRSSAVRLNQLIGKILDFTTVSADEFSTEVRLFAPGDLLRAVVEQHTSRPVYLHMTGDRGVRHGDPTRIAGVLSALVDNAIRHGDATRVDVESHLEGSEWTLVVRDDGCGMSDSEVDRLFQPLTQGDAGLNRQDNTIGLSTAIAKRVIDVMGGTITCRSSRGQGTIFKITLDLEPTMEGRQHRPGAYIPPREKVC